MLYEMFAVEKMKETEQHLRDIGCEQCSVCKMFMGKEYINKDTICNECEKTNI